MADVIRHERPSMTDRLTMRRAELLDELGKIDAALEAIKQSPEAQSVLDAVTRLGYL